MALALSACSEATELVPPTFKTKLKSEEIKNSAFKAEFPLHYETFLRNNESEIMTEYGGSVAYNKHDNVNPLPEGYKVNATQLSGDRILFDGTDKDGKRKMLVFSLRRGRIDAEIAVGAP